MAVRKLLSGARNVPEYPAPFGHFAKLMSTSISSTFAGDGLNGALV